MIKSFAHKGLELFFTTGSKAGVQSIHAARLHLMLAMLDQARVVEDMDAPGLRLHQLKGKKSAYWAVTVAVQLAHDFQVRRGGCPRC